VKGTLLTYIKENTKTVVLEEFKPDFRKSLVSILKMSSNTVPLGQCSYRVMYAKGGVKKRKAYSDGSLQIVRSIGTNYTVTLCTEDGTDLKKSSERGVEKFKVGSEIDFGGFTVQIEEQLDCGSSGAEKVPTLKNVSVSSVRPVPVPFVKPSSGKPFVAPSQVRTNTLPRPNTFLLQPKSAVGTEKDIDGSSCTEINVSFTNGSSRYNNENICKQEVESPWERGTVENHASPVIPVLLKVSSQAPAAAAATAPTRTGPGGGTGSLLNKCSSGSGSIVELDPSLCRVMRPHQVDGALFLISLLLTNTSNGEEESEEPAGEQNADELPHYSRRKLCSGAILADEVCNNLLMCVISFR
jgi:hypothetical protein